MLWGEQELAMAIEEEIRQFLEGAQREGERPWNPDLRNGRHPFVTISRQTGAGGHSLAQALLEEMEKQPDPLFHGWKMFDQELCRLILEDPKLKVSMQSLLSEEYRSQIEDILQTLIEGAATQDAVVRRTFQVLRTLATMGKVILVGRAGCCVTEGLAFGVHLRLVAPEPVRIRRMMRLLNLSSEEEARRVIKRQDADRARLVKDYFNRDINDPLLYNAVWNTDSVALETVAASVIQMIRGRVGTPCLQPIPPT